MGLVGGGVVGLDRAEVLGLVVGVVHKVGLGLLLLKDLLFDGGEVQLDRADPFCFDLCDLAWTFCLHLVDLVTRHACIYVHATGKAVNLHGRVFLVHGTGRVGNSYEILSSVS